MPQAKQEITPMDRCERLSAEVDEYQQREDEIIVALGSKGILPSEIVEAIGALSAEVRIKDSLIVKIRAEVIRAECMCDEMAIGGVQTCSRCDMIQRVEKLVSGSPKRTQEELDAADAKAKDLHENINWGTDDSIQND